MAGIPRHQGRADPGVGMARPPRPETSTDRVARDDEVGLGGGLDQAEEGQLGVTDEELRGEEPSKEPKKPKR